MSKNDVEALSSTLSQRISDLQRSLETKLMSQSDDASQRLEQRLAEVSNKLSFQFSQQCSSIEQNCDEKLTILRQRIADSSPTQNPRKQGVIDELRQSVR